MSIQYDTAGAAGSLTIGNHDRRALFVFVGGTSQPTTPTFNGVSMSLWGNSGTAWLYYLLAPDVGSHTLSAGYGVSLYDVDQTNTFGTSQTAHGDTDVGGNSSCSITLSPTYTGSGQIEITNEYGTQYFNSLSSASFGFELPSAIYSDLNGLSRGSWVTSIANVGRTAHSTYTSYVDMKAVEIKVLGLPTVETSYSEAVQRNQLNGVGQITVLNGNASASRFGFAYKIGNSGDPVIADAEVHEDGTYGAGQYHSITIPNLIAGTDYRIRAYCVTPLGTTYGSSITVTTDTPILGTVVTNECTNPLTTSVDANGEITYTGGAYATRRGFCYITGVSGDPTVSDSVVYEDGTFSAEVYSLSITGLTTDVSYRVRSYIINSIGTSYGDTVQVKTAKVSTSTGNFIPLLK